MKCYYSNVECNKCKKKQHCTIVIDYLNAKSRIYKLEMAQEPPEKEEDFPYTT